MLRLNVCVVREGLTKNLPDDVPSCILDYLRVVRVEPQLRQPRRARGGHLRIGQRDLRIGDAGLI